MSYDYIIGIDPDVDQSGAAMLDVSSRRLLAMKFRFPYLIEWLRDMQDEKRREGKTLCVVVEASWLLRKSNYHAHYGRASDEIARRVGENHEVGKLILECCEFYGITSTPMHPLKKMWRGADGKITADELKVVCGYERRTNQEERDACLLAWLYANLPIRM